MRKDAERVFIPAWPKIHQLDSWKMQLLMNVLSACADPDTDAWTKWLEQALGLNPDLNMLKDSAPPGRHAGLPRGRHEAVAGQQGAVHGGGAPQTDLQR